MAFSGIGRLPMAAIARARLEQLSKQLPVPEQSQGLITARLGMHSRLAMLRSSCEQLVQVLSYFCCLPWYHILLRQICCAMLGKAAVLPVEPAACCSY